MTKFRIHIGAHKTATTHVQNCLFEAQEQLRANKIFYIPRKDFRGKKITAQVLSAYSQIGSSAFNRTTLTELLNQNGYFGETILISDENIIGWSGTLLNGLYPNILGSLTPWKILTRNTEINFFISIRNYRDMLPSAYSQALRDGGIVPSFNHIRDYWLNTKPSWIPMIQKVISLIGASNVTIWTFEKYIQNPVYVLNELAGSDLSGIEISNVDKNARMSADSVKKYELLSKSLNLKERKIIVNEIGREEKLAEYDPLSESEKRIFNERYIEDCKIIKTLGIKFIS